MPVREFASVVYEGHCADGPTDVAGAPRGLFDFATIDLDLHSMRTGETAKEGNFHIGDDRGSSDNESFNAHQLVGVCRVSCVS